MPCEGAEVKLPSKHHETWVASAWSGKSKAFYLVPALHISSRPSSSHPKNLHETNNKGAVLCNRTLNWGLPGGNREGEVHFSNELTHIDSQHRHLCIPVRIICFVYLHIPEAWRQWRSPAQMAVIDMSVEAYNYTHAFQEKVGTTQDSLFFSINLRSKIIVFYLL